MIEITITEIAKKHTVLKEALQKGPVRIVWKEQKPNGKVIFTAIAKKEEKKNGTNSNRKGRKV